MNELVAKLTERIRTSGPLRFDEYVEAALYDPDRGFFARGSGAGRAGGDFLTSPEVGPLFGALFARQLDRLWIEAGRPAAFQVVEAAAGRGALAISVRAAGPECASALTYHLVERSAELRVRQNDHLSICVDPVGEGPHFVAHADLGDLESPVDVIFANELLDNIPFRLLERAADGWAEVYVHLDDDSGTAGELREALVPVPELAGWADSAAPGATEGTRIPHQAAAAAWVDTALAATGESGTVILVDYCRPTSELAELDQSDWLRTYLDHGRGASPLVNPGEQDITCDVAWDQLVGLVSNGSLVANVSQSEWLQSLGVDELVAEGRRIWEQSAGAPDLAAIRARSRITEAEALCDESGLGGFRVLTWRTSTSEG